MLVARQANCIRVPFWLLHGQCQHDVSFKDCALEEEIQRLNAVEERSGITGMPWPWPKLNTDTGGIHDADYIMVWALPKSMKTWFGLVVAANLFKTGRRVLVYSKEMTWENTRSRIAAILAEVNYDAVKQGLISESDKHNYQLSCRGVLIRSPWRSDIYHSR